MRTRLVIVPIHLYRALTWGRPPACRFWPTCSAYAIEAIELHGPLRGAWLTACRVGRCHPWGGWGVDEVPAPDRAGR